MGKRIISIFIFLCILLGITSTALADSESPSIEQVYLNMPDVTIYSYGIEQDKNIEGFLDGEKLTLDSNVDFRGTGEGVQYYVLLDISGSIPKSYFKKMKESILNFYTTLSANDRFSLMTFGETVQTRVDTKVSNDELKSVLDTINNRDQDTLLFDAIKVAVEKDGQNPDSGPHRREIIVLSDGEDFAIGKVTSSEVLSQLQRESISLYALCIKDTKRENIDAFGEVARKSGGNIEVVSPEEVDTGFKNIKSRIDSARVLKFLADNNKVTNALANVTIQVDGSKASDTRQVMSILSQPDNISPTVLEAKQEKGRNIKVKFSEKMLGTSDPANYSLVANNRKTILFAAVNKVEDEENTYILTTAEKFDDGKYKLICGDGITDDSNEKNRVVDSTVIRLHKSDSDIGIFAIALAILAILLAVVGLIILIVSKSKKKEEQKSDNEDTEYVEKHYSVDMPDGEMHNQKYHIKLEHVDTKDFSLLISVKGMKTKKTDFKIVKSFIVGRSSMNELYFDDEEMSRQHFVLEWDGENMYISDLHSTNGTAVNGVRIQGKRKLEYGDEISAGMERMIIQF